jgi:hypothetical protein
MEANAVVQCSNKAATPDEPHSTEHVQDTYKTIMIYQLPTQVPKADILG